MFAMTTRLHERLAGPCGGLREQHELALSPLAFPLPQRVPKYEPGPSQGYFLLKLIYSSHSALTSMK